jgi:hypothetical protein
MGDVVSFSLTNRQKVLMPVHYGIIRIISSKVLDPCVLYVARYRDAIADMSSVPSDVRREAEKYYGDECPMVSTKFVIPSGEWQPLGVVRTAYYDRPGCASDWFTGQLLAGPKFHPFARSYPPVELHQLVGEKLWRLVLPEGCLITRHGFEYP